MTPLPSSIRLQIAGCAFGAALALPAAAAVDVPVSKVELKSAPSNQAFCEGTKCWIVKGATARVMVHGAGVAQANSISDGSAMASELTGAGGVGQKEVNVKVDASASRGEKTVTLKYRLNGSTMTQWAFRVYVINRGKVENVQLPAFNDFFDTAEVEVSGDQLGNARVHPWGMGDFHNPAPTVTRTANDGDTVKVRLTWPKKQSLRAVKFRLCDEALPSDEYCLPVKYGQVEAVAKGPPAISAISFSPQPAKKGEVLSIRFSLTQPARTNGETIWWQLADHTNFESAEPACPFSPAGGRNQIVVPAGSTSVTCKVKVKDATGISAMTQWLKTWVVNPNINDAPYFLEQSLTIKAL
jgi:hypothetical protein